MTQRVVTDAAGRTWTCTSEDTGEGAPAQGNDIRLACETPSVEGPVQLTVGWQWERMAPNGLARMILQASPPPRR
jgi:hypothetical protein